MNSNTENRLGQQLSILANLKGISQVHLAKECRISRISINRFFRGRSELKAGDLVKVLGVLGIDLKSEVSNHLKNHLLGEGGRAEMQKAISF